MKQFLNKTFPSSSPPSPWKEKIEPLVEISIFDENFFRHFKGGVRNPNLPSDIDALLISKRDWLNQKVGQIKAQIASQ